MQSKKEVSVNLGEFRKLAIHFSSFGHDGYYTIFVVSQKTERAISKAYELYEGV